MSAYPFNFLCKIFGLEDVVRIRRKIYSATQYLIDDKYIHFIPSGSRAEGLELENSDFDLMILLKDFRVYETLTNIDPSDRTGCVLMDTEYTKPGFTRLRLINFGTRNPLLDRLAMTKNITVNIGDVDYISSSLLRSFGLIRGNMQVHGPCLATTSGTDMEFLRCFRCKEWISIVQPWTYRTRNTWPCNELINDITRYGVLFVPIGCKTSRYEDIEWRISFSIAEKQLIHSFSHVQFLCYAMLKTVVSDILKRRHGELLCSYFIKTILFWLSEEEDANFWTKHNIIPCYLACLKRLIYCVQYRVCLNYFIPEINFFEERFIDEEHVQLISSLHEIKRYGWEALLHTTTILNFISERHENSSVISSVISPLCYLDTSAYTHKFNVKSSFDKCVKYKTLCTPQMMRFIKYVSSIYSYRYTLNYKLSFQIWGNKNLYRHYKNILPDILNSTDTDCVRGWCKLATLFYELKQFKRCMCKCSPEKLFSASNTWMSIPNQVQNGFLKGNLFTKILRHKFLASISVKIDELCPMELRLIFRNKITEKNNVNTAETVDIPPVVYILFLEFLCDHHLKQHRIKELTFITLQMTVREKYHIPNEDSLNVAKMILKFASTMR